MFGILFFLYCISARLSSAERDRGMRCDGLYSPPRIGVCDLREIKLKQLFETKCSPCSSCGFVEFIKSDTIVERRVFTATFLTDWLLLSSYRQKSLILEIRTRWIV